MFTNAIILGALAAIASASSSSVLTFTHVPNPVTDGQPQALTYATNDTVTPVTILLRHGDAADLQTLQTLTTSASNGQFVWTPCGALPNGNDYALEIRQGNQVNYFGPFAIQGASASGTCSGLLTTASATTSGHSSTTASLLHNNSTITSTASKGASTALHRNTTMSSATLSRTLTSSLTTTTAPTTAGAGFQGSATPSHSNAAPEFNSGVSGSSFALVLGAVAAVFLG